MSMLPPFQAAPLQDVVQHHPVDLTVHAHAHVVILPVHEIGEGVEELLVGRALRVVESHFSGWPLGSARRIGSSSFTRSGVIGSRSSGPLWKKDSWCRRYRRRNSRIGLVSAEKRMSMLRAVLPGEP